MVFKIKYDEKLSEQIVLSKLKYVSLKNKKNLSCIELNKKQ